MKIRKGDTIKILLGKDKGRTAKAEKILGKTNKIIATGVNVYKKHTKPQGEGKPGGIIEISRPLDASKVALICPKCNKITRVGFQISKTGVKERICKKCQAIL
jgi:large subunit ribosomal protein L24